MHDANEAFGACGLCMGGRVCVFLQVCLWLILSCGSGFIVMLGADTCVASITSVKVKRRIAHPACGSMNEWGAAACFPVADVFCRPPPCG